MFTEFNWGSELTWRLPGYSMSIDGRTIFPDSVALDFASADRAPAPPRGHLAERRPGTDQP